VLKRPVFGKSPAEVPCFLNELRQACKTAKPLCVGSIPTRASIPFKIMWRLRYWSRHVVDAWFICLPIAPQR
jgi:hypothetical protein